MATILQVTFSNFIGGFFLHFDFNFTEVCFCKGPVYNKWTLVQPMERGSIVDMQLPKPIVNELTDAYIHHPASLS